MRGSGTYSVFLVKKNHERNSFVHYSIFGRSDYLRKSEVHRIRTGDNQRKVFLNEM